MGNQQGKLQHNQSGRPKKNVHWKSAGETERMLHYFFLFFNNNKKLL